MLRYRLLKLVVVVVGATIGSRAFSLSGDSQFSLIERLGLVSHVAFFSPGVTSVGSYGEITTGKSLDQMASELARDSGLHAFIEMRTKADHLGLFDSSAQTARSYDFWLGGVRIIRASIRAGIDGNGRRILLHGSVPVVRREDAVGAFSDMSTWPLKEQAIAVIEETLSLGDGLDAERSTLEENLAKRSERVFVPGPGGLIPAWEVDLEVRGLPYRAVANEQEVFSFEQSFFDLTASARVFTTNKRVGALTDLSFTISDGQDRLKNSSFETVLAYPNESPATITGGKFDFSPSTVQFREANVFAHANRHLDFLKANGYKFAASGAIKVRVGECTEALCSCTSGEPCPAKSNAFYLPEDSDYNSPSIRIAEGDNVDLKDLHFDAGVVGHELGHHVVVATVTEYGKSSEALALHEGLSDFFVMMQQESACMGSGICTEEGSLCYTDQCLRTAENDIVYGAIDFMSLSPHKKGQVISGMLWDMKQAGVSVSDLVRMVLGAIDLLPAAATFGDFGLALLVADENLFGGSNRLIIEQKSIARGIDKSTRSVSSIDPVVISSDKAPVTNVWGCTAAAVKKSDVAGVDLFMLILFTIPVFLVLGRRPRGKVATSPDEFHKI